MASLSDFLSDLNLQGWHLNLTSSASWLASVSVSKTGDSLGGDAFWALGLSLFSPIPKKEHWPVKLHGFFNAGQLSQIDQSERLSTFRFVGSSFFFLPLPILTRFLLSTWI